MWHCSLRGPNHLKNSTPNARFGMQGFGLKLKVKGGLRNLIFSIGFQMLKI